MDNISSISKASASANATLGDTSKLSPSQNIEPKSVNTVRQDTALEDRTLTVEEIDYAVEVINETMTMINRSLNFQVDEDAGRTVIRIIDRDTDEIIKQIPSEDLLKLISHMQEMQSLLSGQDA